MAEPIATAYIKILPDWREYDREVATRQAAATPVSRSMAPSPSMPFPGGFWKHPLQGTQPFRMPIPSGFWQHPLQATQPFRMPFPGEPQRHPLREIFAEAAAHRQVVDQRMSPYGNGLGEAALVGVAGGAAGGGVAVGANRVRELIASGASMKDLHAATLSKDTLKNLAKASVGVGILARKLPQLLSAVSQAFPFVGRIAGVGRTMYGAFGAGGIGAAALLIAGRYATKVAREDIGLAGAVQIREAKRRLGSAALTSQGATAQAASAWMTQERREARALFAAELADPEGRGTLASGARRRRHLENTIMQRGMWAGVGGRISRGWDKTGGAASRFFGRFPWFGVGMPAGVNAADVLDQRARDARQKVSLYERLLKKAQRENPALFGEDYALGMVPQWAGIAGVTVSAPTDRITDMAAKIDEILAKVREDAGLN